MSYWKSKVVPKLKKFFDKASKKKAGASEACILFNSSKESLDKEIGEKTTDLHPQIIQIYRSSEIIGKKLLKEPNEAAVKENPDEAQNILQALAKAGFPGAQGLSDAASKYGPALLPGPVVYLFQKTSTFLSEEPLPEPKHGTREIAIEETVAEDKIKEPEASPSSPEGEVLNAPQPPPIEPVAIVQKSSGSSEEKKEVIPIIEPKKEELIPVIEAKKAEVAPIEAKQAEVAPIEAKKEVTPTEAKKEAIEAKKEVSPIEAKKEVGPIEAKKEEVASSKEGKKEAVTAAKEVAAPSEGKKDGKATPSEGKKEEKVTPIEGKKEELKSITSVEQKKEKPTP